MSKMKEIYNGQVKAALQKEFSFSNVHQIPRISKVVINIGLGDSSQNSKALDAGVEELTKIAGQKPLVTRAKKSVAGFKVRENMPIGAMVTLRQDRMYDFLTKLVCVAMPRIRDFRGLNEKGFDGHGNYNIGLKDQLIFPEIDYDKVSRIRGMNITIVTDTNSDIEAKALLTHLGFPFKKPKQQKAG
ncbi:MAG: 50S ribosomal protein L5 [Vampirovibrio sp.]|nr:50S ribosomal protein L5 [Vampirovibrio sp.]